MLTMLRHALSILLLPFLVVVAMPYWLLTTFSAIDYRWSDSSLIVWLPRSVGTLVFIVGFGLFSWCVSLFARVGQGTPRPLGSNPQAGRCRTLSLCPQPNDWRGHTDVNRSDGSMGFMVIGLVGLRFCRYQSSLFCGLGRTGIGKMIWGELSRL